MKAAGCGSQGYRRSGAGLMNRALAFIFDLDGTLVETEELKALSYAEAAAELRPCLGEAHRRE